MVNIGKLLYRVSRGKLGVSPDGWLMTGFGWESKIDKHWGKHTRRMRRGRVVYEKKETRDYPREGFIQEEWFHQNGGNSVAGGTTTYRQTDPKTHHGVDITYDCNQELSRRKF